MSYIQHSDIYRYHRQHKVIQEYLALRELYTRYKSSLYINQSNIGINILDFALINNSRLNNYTNLSLSFLLTFYNISNHDTTLTAWFKLNEHDASANKYLYAEIPHHYVFNKTRKQWCERKLIEKPIISRMFFVNSLDHERFYIRLLLQHVRGATSFED